MHLAKHLCGLLLLFSLVPRLIHAQTNLWKRLVQAQPNQKTATEIGNLVKAFRSLGKKNLPLYMTVFVETFWSSEKFSDKYKSTTSSQVSNLKSYLVNDHSWYNYLKSLNFLGSETSRSSMNDIIGKANGNKEFVATVEDELEVELELPIKVPPDLKNSSFLTSWTLLDSSDITLESLTTRQVLNSIVDDYISWTSMGRIDKLKLSLNTEQVYKRQAELLLLVRPRFIALHQLRTSLETELVSLKDPNLGDGCAFSQYIETISNNLRLDGRLEYSLLYRDTFKAYMAPFAVSITHESPVSLSDLDYDDALIKEYIKPEEKIDIPEWVAPLNPVTVSKFNSKIMYKVLASNLFISDFILYYEGNFKYRVTFRKMYRMQALWCIAILPKWKEIHGKLENSRIPEKVPPDIENQIKSQLAPKLALIASSVNGVAPENTPSTNYGTFVRILFQCLISTPRFHEHYEKFPEKDFETILVFLRQTLQNLQIPNLHWPDSTPTNVYLQVLPELQSVKASSNMNSMITTLLTTKSNAREEATRKWSNEWKQIAESFKWRYSVDFDRSFADHFLEQLWSTSSEQCVAPRPVRLLARLLVSFLPLYETAIEKATLWNNLQVAIKEQENEQKTAIIAKENLPVPFDQKSPKEHIVHGKQPTDVIDKGGSVENVKKWYQNWKVLASIVTGLLLPSAAYYFDVLGIRRFLTGSSLPTGTNFTTASIISSTGPPLPLLSIILVLSVILLLILLLYMNPCSRAGQPKDAKSKVQTKKTEEKSKRSSQKKTTSSSTPSSIPVSEVLKPLKASSAAPSQTLTHKPPVCSTGSTTTSPLKVSSKPLKAPNAAPLKSSALTRKPSVSPTGSTTTSPLKVSTKALKAPSAAPSRALTRKPSVSSPGSITTSPLKALKKPLKAPSATPSRALTRKPSVNSPGSTITSPQGRSKFQNSTIF